MSQLASVKYIFLDVVGFTVGRSVEAQADIVNALNEIVRESVSDTTIKPDKVIFLPTGDGLCIALIDIDDPYDVHIRLATRIVSLVEQHNAVVLSTPRKFLVRIGVNTNIDNLVTDINGRPNLAGAGINFAARVMSLADGNQILVSSAVYEVLRYRELYESSFKHFEGEVKHRVRTAVYQLIGQYPGLSTAVPREFQPKIRVIPNLDGPIAFYFALSHKFRDFIMEHNAEYHNRAAIVWLWYRALDANEVATAKPFERPDCHTFGGTEISDIEQLRHYEGNNFGLVWDFVEYLISHEFAVYTRYFEEGAHGIDFRFVNSEGWAKVESDFPAAVEVVGTGGT
jgi:class 3 adenylate cyclase